MTNRENRAMNKKMATGAVIVLALGIVVYFYRRNKNKIDEVAAEAYDKLNDKIKYAEVKAEGIFS